MARGVSGLSAVEVDARRNLVGICVPVAQHRINFGPGHHALFHEGAYGVGFRRKVFHPHGDLPDIGATEQPGATTGWPIPEGDEGVLIVASPFLGITAKPVGQRLPCSPGSDSKALGETVIQPDRHIDRHVGTVAHCQRDPASLRRNSRQNELLRRRAAAAQLPSPMS